MSDPHTPEDVELAEHALTKALFRMQVILNIHDEEFARILSITEAHMVRIRNGMHPLRYGSHTFHIAIRLMYLWEQLMQVSAGDTNTVRSWLTSRNTGLGDIPLNVMHTYAGLEHVIDYLRSRGTL